MDSKKLLNKPILGNNKNLIVNKDFAFLPASEDLIKNFDNKWLNDNFENLINRYNQLYKKDFKDLSRIDFTDFNFLESSKPNYFTSYRISINSENSYTVLKITEDLSFNTKLIDKYIKELLHANSKTTCTEILTLLMEPTLIFLEFEGNYKRVINLEYIIKNSQVLKNSTCAIFVLNFAQETKVDINFELSAGLNNLSCLNLIGFLGDKSDVNIYNYCDINAEDKLLYCSRWFLGYESRLNNNSQFSVTEKLVCYQNFSLNSEKANVSNNNQLILNDNAQVCFFVNQLHQAQFTQSDTKVKSVAGGLSYLSSKGQICIEKECDNSNAAQRHDSLLFSPQALVIAQPALEVKANKISCRHGSAIAKIADDQVWHLSLRGLNKCEGKKMLLNAFLNLDNIASNNSSRLKHKQEMIDSIVNSQI